MAKVSVGLSFTINFTSGEIEYAKIDARIEDVDLEQPIDVELGNFDEVSDKAFKMLKKKIKSKIEVMEQQ